MGARVGAQSLTRSATHVSVTRHHNKPSGQTQKPKRGSRVGASLGWFEGWVLSSLVGPLEGFPDGRPLGEPDGRPLRVPDGSPDGVPDGSPDGSDVGSCVVGSCVVGFTVVGAAVVGSAVVGAAVLGLAVGLAVGSAVSSVWTKKCASSADGL